MKMILSSLALMVALGSFSAFADGGNGHRKGPPEEVLKQLPEEKAALIQSAFKQLREETKPIKASLKAKHKELKTIVSAESFNKSAFLAKHDEIRDLKEQLHQKRTTVMADVLQQLTPEQRKMMSEMKYKRRFRGKKKS